MSRSYKSKVPRYKDFWKRRPLSGYSSCKWAKVLCHRIERAQAKQQIVNEIKTIN